MLPQSLATWHALNGESPNMYPVLLHLSRPLDAFEREAIGSVPGYVPSELDAADVLLAMQTLEAYA